VKHILEGVAEDGKLKVSGAVWSAVKKKLFGDGEPTLESSVHASGFQQTLLFNQFNTSDKIVAACAAVSQAIYSIRENTAELKDANGDCATAFFLSKAHMHNLDDPPEKKPIIHDYIPDETIVELIDPRAHVESLSADSYQAINIRWAGASGYIRRRHIKESFGTLDEGDTQDDYGDQLRRFLNLKGLKPDTVTIVQQSAKSSQPNSLRNPCAICVLDIDNTKVCIVGWGGTDIAKRPMDVLTDLGATPTVCPLWHDKYPAIQAHSSMVAIVQGDFATKKLKVLNLMKKTGCKKLLFTGHSLGGGCAVLAHLITLAQQENALAEAAEHYKEEGYKDMNINVESIVFAAPAPFYEQGVNEDEFPDHVNTRDFRKPLEALRCEMIRSSTNFVCHHDLVPRLPHNVEFVRGAVKEMISTLASSHVGDMMGLTQGIKPTVASTSKKVIAQLYETYLDGHHFQNTVTEIKKYRHLSKIVYMKSDATCEKVGRLEMRIFDQQPTSRLTLQEHEDTGDSEAFQYYFACHLWFPQKVKFSETPVEPGTNSNDYAAAPEELSRGQSCPGVPYPSQPSTRSLVSEPSSQEPIRRRGVPQ